MKQVPTSKIESTTEELNTSYVTELVTQSFKKIAPFWPLKNVIAVNPLQGLEDLPIEKALVLAAAYFEQKDIPEKMEAVNRETIKWLQVYLDDGQATLLPSRSHGLYQSWRQLALYDVRLHEYDRERKALLTVLPENAHEAITQCLLRLAIPQEEQLLFVTLMLSTLPGWASYIKYRTEWAGGDKSHQGEVTQEDYVAIRLVITTLLWPEAKDLLNWYKKALNQSNDKTSWLETIETKERGYKSSLLEKLAKQGAEDRTDPQAQFVFCIDVRSEPFRRSIESTGNYETFGFAGFFGVPVRINNSITNESYASCPVLLRPKHEVKERPSSDLELTINKQGYERLTLLKRVYQSLKYTFTTPFALVEGMGIMSGVWMGMLSLMPGIASRLKAFGVAVVGNNQNQSLEPLIDAISFTDQCSYALNVLRMMGLTNYFAPLVLLCGHGSTTQNNAHASALDCGACGGRHGASNARILAAILNRLEVRIELGKHGIIIPQTTRFMAAEHDTTTDEVTLYGAQESPCVDKLKKDLLKARNINNLIRLQRMKKRVKPSTASSDIWLRSQDWAEVRPEWGLARNSAFIVAPRAITAGLDLEGRSFLHSYDYQKDSDGRYLTTILTAPMVVAQWINMQYLFSTLNNVAYGAGSKITKNITGKIGIMQGNASDLMTGFPLQSVYSSDKEAYHEPQRLVTVVFAPRSLLDTIIASQSVLQNLFGNGWVHLGVIEPDSRKTYLLNRDFTWQETDS